MQPTADLSILTLVANASLVVKCVLAILVFLSLASWTVIFQKYFTIPAPRDRSRSSRPASGAARSSISFLKPPSAITTPQASKSASSARA